MVGRGAAGRALVLVAAAFVVAPGAASPTGTPALPAADGTRVSLFLIGDAGKPDGREPVLRSLGEELERDPASSLVLFLGDNVYPQGLPAPGAHGRAEMERRLDAQIEAVRGRGARGIFVPGNHDWEKGRSGGWEAVKREGDHVVARGAPLVDFLPRDGCPGPEVVDVDPGVRLVLLDTQWWLQEGPKPRDPASACGADSEAEVLAALRRALEGAGERYVVVAAHHPLASGGPHGGHFSLREHVFPLTDVSKRLWIPLPLLGSIYPLARKSGALVQDLSHERNRRMRAALESVLRAHPPLVYASGHEHTLQVLESASAQRLLVSGAGVFGHTTRVERIGGTRFARAEAGFMRLDFERTGGVRLAVVTVDARGFGREAYSERLAPTPRALSGRPPGPP